MSTESTKEPEKETTALTPELKKTIWEWTKYLGKALLTAIVLKLIASNITTTCLSNEKELM